MRTEFAKLLKNIRKAHPDIDDTVLREAYRVADKAHQGQTRLSGEPYITHTLEVAQILCAMGLDIVTISASLLHDVLEDTPVTYEDLKKQFGEDIADLVEGVSKTRNIHMANVPTTREQKQAENLRKMLVATAKDVRVILIKLADRLHNMRTLQHQNPNKVRRICAETLDIYAPVANRLGLSQWKWELEDHAFHHLYPEEYKETARMVAMKRREREELVATTMELLEARLKEAEVDARVIGRPKHLYSIFQKMNAQGKTFDQILDALAVRIITQTVSDCYNALGVVHHLWRPIPGRFKDYVATPKLNMYQSIHTSVILPDGNTMEVQIRTKEMDRTAREGIAAHWKYKDGVTKVDSRAESQLNWIRQMYDWLKDAQGPEDLFESLRRDIGISAIYAFTPQGDVQELPSGATPLDFAYAIHSDVGHQCLGARVNGSMVPLRYHIQTGDVVEILTSKNQTPHLDWLEIVVTGRARTRIRQKLREIGDLPTLEATTEPRPTAAPPIKKRAEAVVRHVDDETRAKLVRVEGARGMEVVFARCCNAMPGHPIIGYVTTRHSISIHRADCKLLGKNEHNNDRMVEASWEGDKVIKIAMWVSTGARPNVLADLTNAMRPLNLDVTHAEYRPGDGGDAVFVFVFETTDESKIERVTKALRMVSGVTAVSNFPAKETEPRLAAQ